MKAKYLHIIVITLRALSAAAPFWCRSRDFSRSSKETIFPSK